MQGPFEVDTVAPDGIDIFALFIGPLVGMSRANHDLFDRYVLLSLPFMFFFLRVLAVWRSRWMFSEFCAARRNFFAYRYHFGSVVLSCGYGVEYPVPFVWGSFRYVL